MPFVAQAMRLLTKFAREVLADIKMWHVLDAWQTFVTPLLHEVPGALTTQHNLCAVVHAFVHVCAHLCMCACMRAFCVH